MPYCQNNAILTQYPPAIKINFLPCNRWSCPDCCICRKAKLKGDAFRGRPNTFITLTVNPKVGSNPNDRAQSLVNAWRKVRRRAKKQWGNVRVPFIAVFETTKKDEAHLHVLCRIKWIPQDWLSDQMKAEIGAPIVDIRRVTSRKKAAAYVSKYVGKNPEKFEGCKRYWRSLDWFVEPKKEYINPLGPNLGQWFERGTCADIVRKYTDQGYEYLLFTVGDRLEEWLQPKPFHYEERPPPEKQMDLFLEGRRPQEPRGSQ